MISPTILADGNARNEVSLEIRIHPGDWRNTAAAIFNQLERRHFFGLQKTQGAMKESSRKHGY
jgi:hypothetical protein